MAIEFIYAPRKTNFNSLENEIYELIADADIMRAQKKYNEALLLYKKASLLGNIYAIRWVGQIYIEGLSQVGIDYERAIYWYRIGAELNDKFCIANIGLMYLDGCGVSQNNEKALAYLKRSSNMGNPVASYWIGKMYYDGIASNPGDNPNTPYEIAINYYNIALSQDNNYTPAINGLAFCYMDGKGISQNLLEAEKLLKSSMELGSKKAETYYKTDLKNAKKKLEEELKAKQAQIERELAIKRAQEAKKKQKRKERIEIAIFVSIVIIFYLATQGILVEIFLPICLIAFAIGMLIVFIKDQEEKEERHKSQYDSGVKCYHCGSTNVYRMNYDDKRASISFWGASSSKIGMTYHCDSCGREW